MAQHAKPVAEKKCCQALSCPKCFSSPLSKTQLVVFAVEPQKAAVEHVPHALLAADISGLDRPPKIA